MRKITFSLLIAQILGAQMRTLRTQFHRPCILCTTLYRYHAAVVVYLSSETEPYCYLKPINVVIRPIPYHKALDACLIIVYHNRQKIEFKLDMAF